uniref:BTB domain-containing protein n=1 Tax=Tetradesmus obliquus TaxID=3088 RepID=A0A383W3D1_TETOB|eukprot:jgi/Sobl393_1/12655/SZX71622.1
MTSQTTRGHKRKLADNNSGPSPSREPSSSVVEAEVKSLIQTVRDLSSRPVEKIDRAALRKAAHALADYCKTDELVELIVQNGAVDAVVPLLTIADKAEPTVHQSFTEVRKEACFILGLLAVKPEYQHQIATAQALPGLVKLLQAHNISSPPARTASFGGASGGGNERSGSGGVARRAADAITNLAHENLEIKNMVRQDGGIAPLVRLLSSWDLKVQRAGAGALRTLAFKNDDNKRQIVDCGALPLLIQMLRSEDPGVHYEAVGVIGNLVHSSQDIKQRVLEEGALQPVINLLGSSCSESQREAALLLGQFATQTPNDDGPDYKSRIVQRGAVPPLIRMLSAPDTALKEMAAFALGRLAQNSHNQAGIVQGGGLPLLLELLESKHINLQHNAAFALYGISDNEDNIPCIIQVGGLQRLHDCGERLTVQASKDCVNKTIARIKQKLERDDKRVLNHVIYTMRSSDRSVQQAVAVSLAQLAPTGELKNIYVDKAGLDVLLELLTDRGATAKTLQDGAAALLELAKKVNATSPVEAQPQQPTKSVYLGEEYVNSKTLADICFLVEGRPFYAHRIALLASSEAFRAMFNQGFRESEASSIDIPNISYETFTAMMRYIYVGSVEVEQELALPLLQASDQYLLEGLKRLCEAALAQSLSVENLVDVWQASEAYSAPQLAKRCVLFALEHCTEIIALDSAAAGGGAVAGSGSVCGSTPTGSSLVSQASASMQIGGAAAFAELMIRMVPALRSSLLEDLAKAAQQQQAQPQNNQQQQQNQQQNNPGPGGGGAGAGAGAGAGGGAAVFMQQVLQNHGILPHHH